LTARGVQKDDDAQVVTHRRPPLVSRQQVVEKAVELLASEGITGLSMRKLAGSLHVSLPTVYTAIESRNQLVQDVLDLALQRQVREVGDATTGDPVDATAVLERFVEHNERRGWMHDLVGELDTVALIDVVRQAAQATSPSVLDRLASALPPVTDGDGDGDGSDVAGQTLGREPATLLLLIVLLLDDVARLVAANCCPAERRGILARALLDTLLRPAPCRDVVAVG
jgi:AcrR family transcriptional regulator